MVSQKSAVQSLVESFLVGLLLTGAFFILSCSESALNNRDQFVNYYSYNSKTISYGGSFEDVAISSEIAYVAKGFGGVDIFDFEDEESPEHLASVVLGEPIYKVRAKGDYLYAMSDRGLYVIDIEDPEEPRKVFYHEIDIKAKDKLVDIEVVFHSEIFVLSHSGYLFDLDLSDLGGGVDQIKVKISSRAEKFYDMELSKGALYFAAGTRGIVKAVWVADERVSVETIYSDRKEDVEIKALDIYEKSSGVNIAAATTEGLSYLELEEDDEGGRASKVRYRWRGHFCVHL